MRISVNTTTKKSLGFFFFCFAIKQVCEVLKVIYSKIYTPSYNVVLIYKPVQFELHTELNTEKKVTLNIQ